MRIAVTGANGSVGRNLLAHAAVDGEISAIAVVRSERAVGVLPNSPRISPRVVSYDDVGGMTMALDGACCVVHLAGILIESRSSNYASANVASTVAVVEASKEAGVQHIVLISVLGATSVSPNEYFRSKGEAEEAVAESGIPSTIIRTPILLGPGTAGTKALVTVAGKSRARLLGGGSHSLRPLDVDDLSRGILKRCSIRPEGASVHELAGPESILYRDLVTRFAGLIQHEVSVATLPIWAAKMGAAITNRYRKGGISPTVIDVITADEVVDDNAVSALGISLTPLAETLQRMASIRMGS